MSSDSPDVEAYSRCTEASDENDRGILAFYGHQPEGKDAYLSNFALIPFKCEHGYKWHSVEQYFAAAKAHRFLDLAAFKRIYNASEPAAAKKEGRKIEHFKGGEWAAVREEIMFKGIMLKFSQNETFRQQLLNTKNMIIVEASPKDQAWGVGCKKKVAKGGVRFWNGQNMLGDCLMRAREQLRLQGPGGSLNPGDDDEEMVDDEEDGEKEDEKEDNEEDSV